MEFYTSIQYEETMQTVSVFGVDGALIFSMSGVSFEQACEIERAVRCGQRYARKQIAREISSLLLTE